MASSNRHWPSMFKSKPNCNPHQWPHLQHHDLLSSATPPTCLRSPFTSAVGGGEERSPEPKPRWNPKPEQIRILEAIFNSGMVNPPRDEIRKIRAQLQEFGQVGDANVFYWFQNRKSRSKHKLRHIHNQNSSKINHHQQQQNKTNPNPDTTTSATTLQAAPTSSSSSSSDKSSPKGSKRTRSAISGIDHNMTVTPSYFQSPQTDFLPEPFFFPAQLQTGNGVQMTQGFCFQDQLYPSNVIQDHHAPVGPCTSLLLSEILNNNDAINAARPPPKNQNQGEPEKMLLKMHQQQPLSTYTSPPVHANNVSLAAPPPSQPPPTTANINHTVTVASTVNHINQGVVMATGQVVDSGGGAGSTVVVFINDVAFEVGVGPFNVREAFGDDVLLIQSSGHPVLTNDWGVTLQSLHHGAFYYLVPLSITSTTSATQYI